MNSPDEWSRSGVPSRGRLALSVVGVGGGVFFGSCIVEYYRDFGTRMFRVSSEAGTFYLFLNLGKDQPVGNRVYSSE